MPADATKARRANRRASYVRYVNEFSRSGRAKRLSDVQARRCADTSSLAQRQATRCAYDRRNPPARRTAFGARLARRGRNARSHAGASQGRIQRQRIGVTVKQHIARRFQARRQAWWPSRRKLPGPCPGCPTSRDDRTYASPFERSAPLRRASLALLRERKAARWPHAASRRVDRSGNGNKEQTRCKRCPLQKTPGAEKPANALTIPLRKRADKG